jgi:hypothetical protein
MKAKLGFFVGFGVGYVVGAKAGRERYDQLRRLFDNVVTSPTFQQASGKAKDAVGTGFDQAREKASEGVAKVTGKQSNLAVAPPPT